MSICRTSGRKLLALSTKSSVRSEYVLSGHAILDRSFANGVSSLPHAYQGWSDFASGRQDQRVPKLVTAMVRGFSTNRDEEGSQASQKQESRKESAHRDSRANKDNPLEHEDSACDRSSDHKPPESSGRPEHDTQQDAAAQQEQAPSMDEAAENTQPEQQQQSDSDPLATGMEGAGWADSEMAQKFKEDLQRLSGQNTIERHVREDPTWFPVLLWDGLVAGPIRAFWHSRLLRYSTRNFEKSEFLEGCLDAFHMVLKVWSNQDWNVLSGMTSPRLSKVFREMSEEYAANRLTLHMEPEGEISASLREVKFLSPAGLARYEDDAKESKEPEPDAKASTTDESGLEGFQSLLQKTADGAYATSSQWHLVLTVVFHGSVKLTEVNAGGQVVREMIDKKPQKWRFCSTDTVALRETKVWQGLPLFLFEKLDATDPDQWELLEVV